MTRTRRIGPIGTTTRLIAAATLLYLALFDGTSWGLHWYDAVLGLVVLPGLMLTIALVARHRGTGPIQFTGATATMLNCAVIVALLGLVLLPGLMLTIALVARHRGTGPIRFTGATGTMFNCAVIVALLANPYTAEGAALFYGVTLLAAAWRGQPGCEATVISNWILRRDDQIGCPTFSPIDHAEGRRASRTNSHHGRARTSPVNDS